MTVYELNMLDSDVLMVSLYLSLFAFIYYCSEIYLTHQLSNKTISA